MLNSNFRAAHAYCVSRVACLNRFLCKIIPNRTVTRFKIHLAELNADIIHKVGHNNKRNLYYLSKYHLQVYLYETKQ